MRKWQLWCICAQISIHCQALHLPELMVGPSKRQKQNKQKQTRKEAKYGAERCCRWLEEQRPALEERRARPCPARPCPAGGAAAPPPAPSRRPGRALGRWGLDGTGGSCPRKVPRGARAAALRLPVTRRSPSPLPGPPCRGRRGGSAEPCAAAVVPRRPGSAISRETGRAAPLCRRDNGGGQRPVTSCVRFPKRSPGVANGTQTAIVPATL